MANDEASPPDGADRPGQTERMLRWIARAMAAGVWAIAVAACSSYSPAAGIRFFAIGMLAAVTAAVAGGALGLLFGLPVNSRVVVVRASDSAADGTKDWYGDNNAMEQIVDWLTKIIVGLGLIQSRAIAAQFDRVAGATAAAMGVRLPAAGTLDGAKLVGGAILLAYLLLGFTAVFLWARRYLKREYTEERVGRLDQQTQAEQRFLERTAAANTQQRAPKDDGAAKTAQQVVEQKSSDAALESAGPGFGQPLIFPGRQKDDPWYGQFGGRARRRGASLEATVKRFRNDASLFAVTLTLRGLDEPARRRLAGTQARLYLHPTFPDSIRELAFDAAGEIRLPLLSYGAFAVGAQLADGTLLELRLADIPGVPQRFKDN